MARVKQSARKSTASFDDPVRAHLSRMNRKNPTDDVETKPKRKRTPSPPKSPPMTRSMRAKAVAAANDAANSSPNASPKASVSPKSSGISYSKLLFAKKLLADKK